MVLDPSAQDKQLAARIERLDARIAKLVAEKVMYEEARANNARRIAPKRVPSSLRKNAISRLTVQGIITRFLADRKGPATSQQIYETLPGLKAATFRSHLKRLVDAGVLEREGTRGSYKLKHEAQHDTSFDQEQGSKHLRWNVSRRL